MTKVFKIFSCILCLAAASLAAQDSLGWLLDEAEDKDYTPLFDADIVAPAEVRAALVAYKSGEFRQAVDVLDKVKQLALPDGNYDFVTFALAECYRMLQIKDLATANYQAITTHFPHSDKAAPSYFRLIQFAYEDAHAQTADSLFKLFNRTYTAATVAPAVLYTMGKLYFREGKYLEAYQAVGGISKNSSWYCPAQFLAGLCYIELKEYEKALFALQYVSKQAGSAALRSEAMICIGDIYYLRDNIETALRFYASVTKDAPRFSYIQVKRVQACLDAKQFGQAKALAEDFLFKYPGNDYYFEMASLLERAYNGLNEKNNATRINATIYRQLSDARLAFEVYDELDTVADMIRMWELIELDAIRDNNGTLLGDVRKNITALKNVQSQDVKLINQLGARALGRGKQSLAGMSERRYISMMKDSMRIFSDSVLAKKSAFDLFAGNHTDTTDTASLLLQNKLALELDTLRTQYAFYEHEYTLVTRECLGTKVGEVSKDQERQIQFIDWAFVKYQDKEKELLNMNKQLSDQSKKAQKKDTSAAPVTETSRLFSVNERDKFREGLVNDRYRLMNHIKTLIEMYPKSPNNPPLLFRLSELYYHEASDSFDVALQEYDRRIANGDSAVFPEYQLEPILQVYDQMVRDYPRDDLADNALFYKGLALQKLGKDEDANTVMQILAEKYPESEYFVEANMSIGRYYFDHPTIADNTGYAKAEEAFRKVLYYRDHPQFVQALYHLGWCYYMQDQYEEAISVFKYLVEEVDLDFDPRKRELNQVLNPLLRGEAIDYIAISFNEEGHLDDAIKFLKLIGNVDYASVVLKRVGELREEDLDYKGAIEAYQRLIDEYPTSLAAPDASVSLIKLYEMTNMPFEALKERESFFDRFSRGSEWQQTVGKVDSVTVARIDSMAIAIGLFVGDAFYRTAETSKKPEDYQKAADSYGRLVSKYADHARAAEALWNLAIILETKLGKPMDAYSKYLAYSKLESVKRDRREQAALNAVAIAQKDLPTDTVPSPEGQMDITAVKLIEAVDNYNKLFPDGASRGTVLLTEGTVFFNRKMYGNAGKIFEEITSLGPAIKEYYQAYFLLGKCHYGEENWKSAAEAFKKVWKESASQEQKSEAFKLLLQCEFFNAKQLLAASNFTGAAQAFTAMEAQYPGSEYSDVVLFNAGGAYEKLLDWDNACGSYYQLFRKYPASKLAPEGLYAAALDFEKAQKYQKAAEAYELLVSQYPKSEKAKDGLFNLGFCYEKLNQPEKMAEINERYSLLYPGEKDVEAMLLRSADYYFKSAMYDRARAVYKNFATRFSKNPRCVEAFFMIGRTYAEQKDEENARLNYTEAEKFNQRLGEAGVDQNNFFAAEAAYYLGNIQRKKFETIKFALPVKTIKDREKQKTELLTEAAKAYQRVIQYQSERMFEAAFTIGTMYDELAQDWYGREREKLDPIKEAVFEKDLCLATSALIQKSFIPYKKVLEIAAGFDSLKADQKQWVEKAKSSLQSGYYRAGKFILDAGDAMAKAPIPKEIQEKPVYYFQYVKQLIETVEPMKLSGRKYFFNTLRALDSLKLQGTEAGLCRSELARVNYSIGGDYDKLSQDILKASGNLPAGLSDDAKEEIVFSLEDVVFEVQDKAIAKYQEAMAFATDNNLQDAEWFPKILESLARLSPDEYGKQFYVSYDIFSGQDWIARTDSVQNWATTDIPQDGWSAVTPASTKLVDIIPAASSPVMWLGNPPAKYLFFWKHVFFNGFPRGANIYIATTGRFRLYINGALTLSDTIGNRTLQNIDSATGITSLAKGGDNSIACQVFTSDTVTPGLAIAFTGMIDSTQHFESKIKLPTLVKELEKKAAQEAPKPAPAQQQPKAGTTKPQTASAATTKQPATGKSGIAQTLSQPYVKQFRNKGEMLQAITDYQTKEIATQKEIRRERLEIQKLQLMYNAVNLQVRMVQDEIKNTKATLDTMGRGK